MFPLHPETPQEGRTMEDLFAGRGLDVPAMMARLKRKAEELGLPFGVRTMTFNSRRAQELGKWAWGQGAGPAYDDAVFRAYFAEGRNIAETGVLLEAAAAAGLDRDQAAQALESGQFAAAVDGDWARSRTMGVTAVPTFVAGGRGLVGAQSYEALEGLVRAAGASPRGGRA